MTSLGPVVAKQYIKKQGHKQSSTNNHLVHLGRPPAADLCSCNVPGRAAVPLGVRRNASACRTRTSASCPVVRWPRPAPDGFRR